MPRFELKVAVRHLFSSHGQTELTVGAIAVGVLLVVFLSSLINGLRLGLIEDVVGTIPHVIVEAAPSVAKPLWQVRPESGADTVTKIEKMSARKRKIEDWQRLTSAIRGLKDVEAVSASVQGSGFVGRGAKKVGAAVVGIVPSQELKVTSLRKHIVEGRFGQVDQKNAAIGVQMAQDLGAVIGTRIRITSDENVTQTFRVAAIFDLGIEQANKSTVYVGLSAAQAMFKIGKNVTTVNVRGRSIFAAEKIANQIRSFCTLLVTSWMSSNKSFLDTLKMQSNAAMLVQGVTLLASAFGVASVMIVFVVQKARDIGILKSMGATSAQVKRIFMFEGLGVGIGGAVIGSGVGTGLCFLVKNLLVPGQTFGGKPATIVPMEWDILYVLLASAVAIFMGLMSSVVPASRAARLNPVEAIRRGL